MKKKSLASLLFAIFITIQFGCTTGCTTTEKISTGLVIKNEMEYFKIIENNTQEIQSYQGFYNNLDLKGTLLNSEVIAAQTDQMARLFLWDKQKYEAEFFKTRSESEKQTKVFISLFTPERHHNDLNKKNSVWKIFLDVDGKRYEGTATKSKQLLRELNSYYPYHTQFSTPYLISFPVNTKEVDGRLTKLILTGPVGSASLEFKN